MRPGRVAAVAHLGDLVAGPDALADVDVPAVDVAVQRDGAVGVPKLDPGAVAGGRTRVDHHAVSGGEDRGADRVGDVDTAVQHAPAVAEARRERALGGRHEQRPLQPRLALRPLLGVGGGLGDLLGVHNGVRGRSDRHHLHPARGTGAGAGGDGRLIRGQHGVGACGLGAVHHGVRGRRGGACGHRRDHQPALDGAGGVLAVLGGPTGTHVDDVGGRDAVADIGVAVAVGVGCLSRTARGRRAALVAGIRPELGRHHKPQRDQVVGVGRVVELGRVDDLALSIERGIFAKLQVIELAELVERNDVGDLGGFMIEPPVPSVRRVISVRRIERTMPRQPEISF